MAISSSPLSLRQRTFTSLSEAEFRFIQIEVALGRFDGQAAAVRHYIRAGMKAEGVLEEALSCV